MRLNLFIAIGAVFALIGILGITLIFPNFMATDGQAFVDQIDTSTGIDKFQDYQVGDEIIIVDKIARMEDDNGNTKIWLESIGNAESDIPFIFKSNIMGNYGIGSSVIISFTVVKDSDGHDTPEGYQNNPPGLSPDAINGRISTVNEYIFLSLMVIGIGLVGYGSYNMVKGKEQPSMEDDWGMAAAPPVAPPAAMPSMAAAPPVAPPAAMPSMAAAPVNQPSTMTITVPPGVVPGQVLTVTMPSGQVVNVQVPSGSMPGSQFSITVQQ